MGRALDPELEEHMLVLAGQLRDGLIDRLDGVRELGRLVDADMNESLAPEHLWLEETGPLVAAANAIGAYPSLDQRDSWNSDAFSSARCSAERLLEPYGPSVDKAVGLLIHRLEARRVNRRE